MPNPRTPPSPGHDAPLHASDHVVISVGVLSACAIAVLGATGAITAATAMMVYAVVSGGTGVWLIAVRTSASDARWRRFLGAALALWGVGQLSVSFEIVAGSYRSPAVGDYLSMLAFPVLAAGVTRAVRSEAFARPVLRMVIDAVLIGAATSLLIWRVAVTPGELSDSTIAFAAAVVLVDVVVGAFGLLVFIRRPQRSTSLFAFGLMLFAIGDLLATFRGDLGAAVPVAASAMYCVAMTAFAVGARIVVPEPDDDADVQRDVREASATIIITAVMVVGIVAHVAVYRRTPMLPPLVFAIVAIVAFFVRHLVDHVQRNDLFARLHHQASTDPLTGLRNRFALDELAERRSSGPIDVVVVGIDGLPAFNNAVGHVEGDAMLIRVATALQERYPDALALVRLESDEFAIVIDGVVHCDGGLIDTAVIARDVADHATSRPAESSARVRVTAGSASGWSAGPDLFDAVTRAQRARHLATTTPGITVRAYDDTVRAQDERDRFIDARLGPAIEQGDIDVHFQPIVLLATGRVVGVESLARWTDPLLGVVTPLEFIGRAEATGQIEALGLLILRKAVQAAVALELPDRDVSIGVNVSALQLRRHAGRGFADDVAAVLAECGLPPGMLAIEVTESVVIEEHGPAIDELRRLSALGIKIAIDDFGSGFWALGYFRWLAADIVKIDRSLISALADDDRSRAVVASIVDLSRRIGMQTIAEGVEDDRVASVAGGLGVDALQGWNYSRAVEAGELVRTIDRVERQSQLTRVAAGVATAVPTSVANGAGIVIAH